MLYSLPPSFSLPLSLSFWSLSLLSVAPIVTGEKEKGDRWRALLFTVSGCKLVFNNPAVASFTPPSPPPLPISAPLFVRRVIRWIRGWATLSEPHERSSRRLYCVLCGARSGVNGRGSTRVCFTARGEEEGLFLFSLRKNFSNAVLRRSTFFNVAPWKFGNYVVW